MTMANLNKSNQQRGSILVSILVVTSFISILIYSLIVLANANLTRARNRILLLQTQYSAESGVDAAIAILNGGNTAYAGAGTEQQVLSNNQYRSTFTTSVVGGVDAKERIITSIGYIYAPAASTTPKFTRRLEVTAQRTSTTTASSVLSRNIMEIQSGVKNIEAVDIYINGFINMNKNTTNLIAENITVADKNTGASNCSIGGTGNLIKPTTFSNAGQTKTNILAAFNNCISPPGNTSNADFDVSANQTSISKIQSTLIPFSQYMDNSYQNSPGNCNDWTTGSFPRDIPSTGNTKKTHYPDSGSGISSSCGTNGDLVLETDQYNIKDHVHLRANLCASAACTPTFNNPDASLKFVFIEGTINFDGIQTTAGSGPIAFITYGADPVSLAADCPYGGSIYLGKNGTTSAPKVYFLATNGICLDKTKFGVDPALGGIGGKNIYVSTNPGSPFDLRLDPSFPTSEIPIDLAWRAIRYRRL
jgi:hypothetical protein